MTKRAVVLIDGDRRVRYRWATDVWTEDPDIREVYDAYREPRPTA